MKTARNTPHTLVQYTRLQVIKGLATGLDIRLNTPVASIEYGDAVANSAAAAAAAAKAANPAGIDP